MNESEVTGSRTRLQDGPATTDKKSTEDQLIPRRSTLNGFAKEALSTAGIGLRFLEPLSKLLVRTLNTSYELTLLDPEESTVLVQGGSYFGQPTEAVLFGSSFGGNLLRVRWIGCGMRMEIKTQDRKIVTSPVRSVEVVEEELPGPF